MENEEQIIDESINQEALEEEEEEIEAKSSVPSWKDLPFIPNKKRFIILTSVFSVIEFAGMIIFTYAFLGSFKGGLWDLGLFLMPPFTGVAIAYFVSQKKEAVAVSLINALSSIVLFMIIFLSIDYAYQVPTGVTDLSWYDFLIPLFMIFVQVAIAFTIARLRNIYRYYGDASITRKSDEAMITELKESRRKRGLEQPEEEENIEETEKGEK